jgi:hypothetical protein
VIIKSKLNSFLFNLPAYWWASLTPLSVKARSSSESLGSALSALACLNRYSNLVGICPLKFQPLY